MIDWGAIALKFGYNDPKKLVSDLYWEKGLSLNETADKLIVSVTALVRFMNENNIKRRDPRYFKREVISGPECPSCGERESKVVAAWGLTDEGYERERCCKECGRYFRTVEMVIKSGKTWRRKETRRNV